MNPDDFNNALKTAEVFRPVGHRRRLDRAAARHDLVEEGEKRPLMLTNRAIERMEHQLETEMEISTEQLQVTFHGIG
jgi:hypothetical protein